MVRVLPMKAFRPPSELAQKISAPPYDVINSDEARKLADGNENSFLRVRRTWIGAYDHFYATCLDLMFIWVNHVAVAQVNKPEIDLPPSISQYDLRVYETGARWVMLVVEVAILILFS